MRHNFTRLALGILTVNPCAIAAIIAVATLASPAHARIVYRPANVAITGTFNLDLNHDGVTDLTFTEISHVHCWFAVCSYGASLSEAPPLGNGIIVGPLSAGANIGPSQNFSGGAVLAQGTWYCAYYYGKGWRCTVTSSSGPWLYRSGYLGLSFQVNGQTHYGWVQLSVGRGTGTLLGYAYETIPGRPILAGQTSYVWFTPSALSFGTVTRGSSATGSVTLTNLGRYTVLFTNATLTGPNSADFASDNSNPPCGGSVAPGASCTLTFTFSPSILGNESAAYLVYDNGGASPQQLPLVGAGQ